MRNLVTFLNVANHGFSKISQVREGGSQNLGTVPKLYHVINYEGFPKDDMKNEFLEKTSTPSPPHSYQLESS